MRVGVLIWSSGVALGDIMLHNPHTGPGCLSVAGAEGWPAAKAAAMTSQLRANVSVTNYPP